ncbi:MAG: hypothetical protein KKE39_07890 [Bacteroidetes bacterium]|nr:hypothetical protein [Bacteroidota bacterium]MBU1373568.1 hypothetical protein [Bacteroidota bacterium]MBU1486379.1 hypothetical protein [Bacteroidota bacterium]MBU1761627.1 hypothetical protein [Bacteroidota bacterium]MBU2045541.1 hypothetical protein [Bacteroidota bacterium]
MSFKTIIIIVLSVLITVIFMQNTDQVMFTILWKEIYVSKLLMMLIVTVFGFIIGVIVARPKKKKEIISTSKEVPSEVHQNSNEDTDYISMKKPNTLSNEDKDYIN